MLRPLLKLQNKSIGNESVGILKASCRLNLISLAEMFSSFPFEIASDPFQTELLTLLV